MNIDITKQINNYNYGQKNKILTEMIEWLHLSVGEYLAYDADPKNNPYRYAFGKGWKILIYRNPKQNFETVGRLRWDVEIKDSALAEMFILKFL